jgi:hypothetical protein
MVVFALLPKTVQAAEASVFEILNGIGDDPLPNEIWLRPILSPSISFVIVKGKYPQYGPLMCKQFTGEYKGGKQLFMNCEGDLQLRITGIDFKLPGVNIVRGKHH